MKRTQWNQHYILEISRALAKMQALLLWGKIGRRESQQQEESQSLHQLSGKID